MLQVYRLPTDLFGANCYVIESEGSDRVLVVDPGLGAASKVAKLLGRTGKRVGAVLLTHGHADHIWAASRVADLPAADGSVSGAPIYLPGPDHGWLENPLSQLSMSTANLPPIVWEAPDLVGEVPGGGWQVLPGILLQMVPAPGHSPGSSVYVFADAAELDGTSVGSFALTGDVIFAGSVGRTDLPGGNEEHMRESLRTLAYALDPMTALLPGHGEATTWETELNSNPYVQRAVRERREGRDFS